MTGVSRPPVAEIDMTGCPTHLQPNIYTRLIGPYYKDTLVLIGFGTSIVVTVDDGPFEVVQTRNVMVGQKIMPR